MLHSARYEQHTINCWIACLRTFTSCITHNRYLKVKKCNSFTIQYTNGPSCLYGEVQVYITASTPSSRLHLAIIRPLIPTPPSIRSIPPPLKSIIVQVQRAQDVLAVPITAIRKKCVLIAIDSLLYVSMPPNDWERLNMSYLIIILLSLVQLNLIVLIRSYEHLIRFLMTVDICVHNKIHTCLILIRNKYSYKKQDLITFS